MEKKWSWVLWGKLRGPCTLFPIQSADFFAKVLLTGVPSHVGGAGVRLEEARDADGVLLLLLHADVHRLHPPEEQPRVERAQPGALRVLEEVDLHETNTACASEFVDVGVAVPVIVVVAAAVAAMLLLLLVVMVLKSSV